VKFGLLVVEGPHDVAFVGRLLLPYGLTQVERYPNLETEWRSLIPNKFPHGDSLVEPVPIPQFFQSGTHSIAVQRANGDKQLAKCVAGSFTQFTSNRQSLSGVGLLFDSDQKQPPDRLTNIRQQLQRFDLPAFPANPGAVSTKSTPRTGSFVLPDNQSYGRLEDLLEEAAEHSYPLLRNEASELVRKIYDQVASTEIPTHSLTTEDLREFNKPAGRQKATLGAMASILKPGKAFQNSLRDNRWLEGAALAQPRIRLLMHFLSTLFDLPELTLDVETSTSARG